MEKESTPIHLSEDELCQLIRQAATSDKNALQKVIDLFEQEMISLSRFIKMPQEDALQTLKLALIELILSGF
ncbi:helix-turn-helix domain-containing protein [Paenibacillus sp. PsM32]|uniref:Helix-turn-helix domain-containing protein n=1 Tax=Paenibacillus kyungheensis TaxID=1452732 RepID=A0AAX3M5P6_9BACL|nr:MULTISPECIES: helix-turn-helix domain-containing protein [Paenibacillus]MDN4616675.1 helix-turn-helix domain-containing protein [Paenibacillus sp. PsM32]MDQ1233539.1 hypothetical protein [Paenibacillus sp. SORGH_AS_0306]MDR6110580.1 hypothetical protein [Paenibacillus sp. SORGH_AS_0338]WCT57462.1 helix-turn-helix domain-containing protein [Paenibacillus kyungheensis]WDF49433.1 helix-turn-helix domain-containing protein [Paenibacillus sp. KACC 21273]